MQALIVSIWRIATLKAGPDILPESSALLLATLLLNVIVSAMLTTTLMAYSFIAALQLTLVVLAATAGILWMLLRLTGFGGRFEQTLTALLGCDLLITLVSAMALVAGTLISQPIANVFLLVTFFWTIVAYGFIFHRALDINLPMGILLAFIILLITISIGRV